MGWLLFFSALAGQVGSSAVTGVVRDPAGAAVAGAAVVLTAVETGATRTAVTTADGVFTAAGLAPGGGEPATGDGSANGTDAGAERWLARNS